MKLLQFCLELQGVKLCSSRGTLPQQVLQGCSALVKVVTAGLQQKCLTTQQTSLKRHIGKEAFRSGGYLWWGTAANWTGHRLYVGFGGVRMGGWSFQGWLGIGGFWGSNSGCKLRDWWHFHLRNWSDSSAWLGASSRICVISSCYLGVKSGVFPWPKSRV